MAIVPLSGGAPGGGAPPIPGMTPPRPLPVASEMRMEMAQMAYGLREWVSLGQQLLGLLREAEPILRALRPPEQEPVERADPSERFRRAVITERPVVDHVAAESHPPDPPAPPPEEEVRAGREELRSLAATGRLTAPRVACALDAFLPFIVGQKSPQLAEAVERHRPDLARFVETFSADEIAAALTALADEAPANDVPFILGLAKRIGDVTDDELTTWRNALATPPPLTPEAPPASEEA